MRKIVVLHSLHSLEEALKSEVVSDSKSFLDKTIKTPGVMLDMSEPIRVPVLSEGAGEFADNALLESNDVLQYSWVSGHRYAVDADFVDDEAEERLLKEHGDLIEGIYSNPEIRPFCGICPGGPIGDAKQALEQLRVDFLHDQGLHGQGVEIAIVDSGVDDDEIPISGGVSRRGLPPPGQARKEHGTMVAYDTVISAPEAKIHDFPIFGQRPAKPKTVIKDAMRAFAALLERQVSRRRRPRPLIVVNSWGMPDSRSDKRPGHPQNYSSNPRHPFNVLAGSLVASGADVFFAAGNCGSQCPFPDCGEKDRGPGVSICGANSHRDVVSVGAISVQEQLLGYSAEGPGRLFGDKPDLVASSHFLGSGIGAAGDIGTSAACAVAAGVAAALRSKPSAQDVHPSRLKRVLMETARQPAGVAKGWNARTGFGIIDAKKAFSLL
jgi:subtilisin family serine protease